MNDFSQNGYERHRAAFSLEAVRHLKVHPAFAKTRPGVRLFADAAIRDIAGTGALAEIVREKLGRDARAVRAIAFDKNNAANWALGWHQDRSIAVRERIDVPGFGHWNVKAGVTHVEPPFPVIEAMVTIRLHLDSVDAANGPLLVVPGSQRRGRIEEDRIPTVVDELGIVSCPADEGDVWVYATPILHASERSTAGSRRRVLQIDYAATVLPGGLEWFGV